MWRVYFPWIFLSKCSKLLLIGVSSWLSTAAVNSCKTGERHSAIRTLTPTKNASKMKSNCAKNALIQHFGKFARLCKSFRQTGIRRIRTTPAQRNSKSNCMPHKRKAITCSSRCGRATICAVPTWAACRSVSVWLYRRHSWASHWTRCESSMKRFRKHSKKRSTHCSNQWSKTSCSWGLASNRTSWRQLSMLISSRRIRNSWKWRRQWKPP